MENALSSVRLTNVQCRLHPIPSQDFTISGLSHFVPSVIRHEQVNFRQLARCIACMQVKFDFYCPCESLVSGKP